MGDAYSFCLAWRWTQPTHNVFSPEVMAQIKPLDFVAEPAGVLPYQLDAKCFCTVRSASADVSIQEGTEWLRTLPVALTESVIVRWDCDVAVETTWEVFTRYWDDFCYPASDDVEVFPRTDEWLLLFHHFEQFEWGDRHQDD